MFERLQNRRLSQLQFLAAVLAVAVLAHLVGPLLIRPVFFAHGIPIQAFPLIGMVATAITILQNVICGFLAWPRMEDAAFSFAARVAFYVAAAFDLVVLVPWSSASHILLVVLIAKWMPFFFLLFYPPARQPGGAAHQPFVAVDPFTVGRTSSPTGFGRRGI
jgi:hypothetical protein